MSAPEFKHEVKDVLLDRRLFPDDIYNVEKANYEALMKKDFVATGNKWGDVRDNSVLFSARNRCLNVMNVHDNEQTDRQLKTSVHAVRIGDASFAMNGQLASRANANRDFLLNCAAYLSGTDAFAASGTEAGALVTGLDRAGRRRLAAVHVFAAPSAVFLVFVAVAAARRRRRS